MFERKRLCIIMIAMTPISLKWCPGKPVRRSTLSNACYTIVELTRVWWRLSERLHKPPGLVPKLVRDSYQCEETKWSAGRLANTLEGNKPIVEVA
jgi:hypothetical protein